MEIKKTIEGNELKMAVLGRLDTITAPDLEKEIGDLAGVTSFIIDFKDLEYISSAGLRVLLQAQKIMNKQGKMVIKNVNDSVMEVFEITGFIDILTVE